MVRILWALVALAAIAGGGATLGFFALPFSPVILLVVAGVLALLLLLSLAPLKVRRPVVFFLVFVLLAGFGGGLYYFQFFIKPNMVKGFIAAAFTPKPSAVAVEPATSEKWTPEDRKS